MSREEEVQRPSSTAGPRTKQLQDPHVELRLQINVRLKLDEVVEVEANALRTSARTPQTGNELCELAARIYDARRTRNKMLNPIIFGEPGWDMLLALYCLPSRGFLMSVTALSQSAEVAQTTGHR